MYYDAYKAPHVRYFGQYTQQWGIPAGAHPLDPGQIYRRGWAFGIERHGRRNSPTMVRVVGFDRQPLDGIMNPWFEGLHREGTIRWSQMRFEYDHLGRLLEERGINERGAQVYVLHYVHADDETRHPRGATAKYSRTDGRDLGEMLITFTRLEMKDENGRLAQTSLGYSVQVMEDLDDQTRLRYYGGADGTTPALDTDKDGFQYHGMDLLRNECGLLLQAVYFDEREERIEKPPPSP